MKTRYVQSDFPAPAPDFGDNSIDDVRTMKVHAKHILLFIAALSLMACSTLVMFRQSSNTATEAFVFSFDDGDGSTGCFYGIHHKLLKNKGVVWHLTEGLGNIMGYGRIFPIDAIFIGSPAFGDTDVIRASHRLPNVRNWNLSGTKVTGTGLRALCKSNGVVEVQCFKCPISADELTAIVKEFPKTRILYEGPEH